MNDTFLLEPFQDLGIEINSAKCVFGVHSLSFLGYVIDQNFCHSNLKLDAVIHE